MTHTTRKQQAGVIAQEVVTVDANDPKNWTQSMMMLGALQTAAQRIEAHRTKALQAIDAGAAGPRLDAARTAVRLFDAALACIARKDTEGAILNTITAMECMWTLDVRAVEPEIITGAKSRRGSSKGNREKQSAADQQKKIWQAKANEIWRRHRAWSAAEVARHIDKDRADYIRKRISRPER